MSIILLIVALLSGFLLLILSANKFVENGAKTASIFNVSPLVIGLIILGFGTSAPEILISILSALDGNNSLGIGNAIGSNILNISLVLGLSAFLHPIKVIENNKKEWLFLALATICAGFLLYDQVLSRIDGIILFLLLLAFFIYAFKQVKNPNQKLDNLDYSVDKKQNKKILFSLVFSLIILILSAKIIVWSSVEIAKIFNVSDLIIGLTVISLGTSLPELALSIASIIKKQYAILVGNIIGSNFFNTVAVLALPGIINPDKIPIEVINRDYVIMLFLTILFFIFSYKFNKERIINRLSGFVFLVIFSFYMWMLF